MASQIGDTRAAVRNRAPIYEALSPWLSPGTRVLEIGSGQGVHARYITERRPDIAWQMSETSAGMAALCDRLSREPITTQPAPITLDVRQAWPAGQYTMIFGANIAHIMPMTGVRALFHHGAAVLEAGGHLCLYGPFFDTRQTAGAGNQRFDAALRARDPAMGLRTRQTLDALAGAAGLVPAACQIMPRDNRLLIWSKR